MVLIFNKIMFPPDQANKVATKFMEWIKDNTPDPSIEKILGIGVHSTEDGNLLAIGISDAAKGKVKEALKLGTEQDLFMAAGVPSLKYKIDVMLDFTEAYKILGMNAPEVK